MVQNRWTTQMLAAVIVAMAAGGGCRYPEPQRAPADPSATAAANSSSAASSGSSSVSPAKDKATSAPPPPQANTLRDILGRLLVSEADGTWRINEQAATDLEAAAPTAEELSALTKDNDIRVRQGAAHQLQGNFNPADREQRAVVAALLDDDDRIVRAFGLAGLNQMRREDQVAAVPRLASLLKPQREDRPENRAAMARFLGRLRDDAAPASEQLAESSASDPDAKVRAASLVALAQVAQPSDALPHLAKSLSDEERSVRIVAAARLRQLGVDAAPAARQLAAALSDEDESVRDAAAEALIRMGPPAARPLGDVLSRDGIEARKLALACLARLGPLAKDALPAIEKSQQDGDPIIRQLAEAAAQRVGDE